MSESSGTGQLSIAWLVGKGFPVGGTGNRPWRISGVYAGGGEEGKHTKL